MSGTNKRHWNTKYPLPPLTLVNTIFFLPELKVSHEEWRSHYILHLPNASGNVAGRKTWKSTTNLTENTSFNESIKKGSTKCSTFYCVPEGYHPDIEDDNEKAHIKECLYMKGKVSLIIRIVSMILSFTNRGLVKLLRVWWFWICWFSSCFFFSLIISLNTSCRVEIGWYSRYRAIRWTVFVWKWNLRTKSCHFPWCWRTRRNTRLILRERLLQSYYAIHQFNLWNHQNVWITNCNSIFDFL